MWDIAWGIGASAYVAGSLINGMQDPNIGILLIAAGGARVLWSLWLRYKS
jgi:hypothetical protein